MALPFRSESFDLVIASDGLYSWDIERDERTVALIEIHRILEGGGSAILTEHLRSHRFAGFVEEITASPLRVETISFFHDRLAYQFESWLKGVQGLGVARALKRSTYVAKVLSNIGSIFGKRGSRHICVVATKKSFGNQQS